MAYIRRHKYKTKVSFQVQIRRKGFRTIVKSFDTRTQAQKWARAKRGREWAFRFQK